MRVSLGTQLLPVVFAFIGIFLILFITQRGVGLSPDSLNYLASAVSIREGKGWLNFDGTPFIAWPPLFPLVISVSNLLVNNPLEAVRLLNALTFGLIVFLTARLLQRYKKSVAFVVSGILVVLFSYPLLSVSRMVWAEPLFVLLTILFILFLLEFLEKERLSFLLFTSVVTGLAALQRYAGVTLFLTGSLLLLSAWSKAFSWHRLKTFLILTVFSLLPLAVWLVRNYQLTSTLTGSRSPSPYTMVQSTVFLLDVISGWLLPHKIPLPARLIAISLFAFTAGTSIFLNNRRLPSVNFKQMLLKLSFIFVVIYCAFLIVSSRIFGFFDPISDRLLIPIYLPVVFLFLIGADNLADIFNRLLPNKRLATLIVATIFALWLISLFYRSAKNVFCLNQPAGWCSRLI